MKNLVLMMCLTISFAGFAKGEKGDRVFSVEDEKGDRVTSTKGEKGDRVFSVKDEKGDRVTSTKGEKGNRVNGTACSSFNLYAAQEACLKAKSKNPYATEKLLSACRQFSMLGLIEECFEAIRTNHSVTYEQITYCRDTSDNYGVLEDCLDDLDGNIFFDF